MIATGRRVIWEQSASSVRNSGDDHRRAANGYLVWPLALANIIRESDDDTIWSRLHARQGLVLGLLASPLYLILLAMPLAAIIAVPTLSAGATIAVYSVGLVADVIAAVVFLLVALRYAARAARGELFAIPLVTPIVDRWFRLKRP